MASSKESSKNGEAQSFTLFSLLPTELRLQIWEQATISILPRLVLLEPKQLSIPRYENSPAQQVAPKWGFRSYCQLPGALTACRESFEVTSKYYQRSFGTGQACPQTWFNFERDYLYLKAPSWRDPLNPKVQLSYQAMLDSLSLEERRKIQHLVLSDYLDILPDNIINPTRDEALLEVIKSFEHVKGVYPVYLDGWTPKDLEKGTQLILRYPPDRDLVVRHLFKAQYRHDKYCACFNRIVDQWEKFRGGLLRNPEMLDRKLAILYPKTKPKVRQMMVLTGHFYTIFSEARKPYNSRASGPWRDYIPSSEQWPPTRTI
ncbi:hypothetical protein BGW36DRAFT_433087 [Talaromyces proteolyticus]|uniref:2EXR domain-containing protein n=1 Tax=Talaromyces proteolyticus TaxID=1131652 RepID=A0AAD4PVC1_9EURO|nr:uncharacterized protein BGW36DRAFT_433087 [Talaromyces proteolyticus]KAH8690133.1 hypothetical protein BGW36DRAFT_433087 [Talaromyces proteolyticus]